MEDAYGTILVRSLRGQLTELPAGVNPDRLIWRACEHGLAGLVARAVGSGAPLGDRLRPVAEKLEALTRVQQAWSSHYLQCAKEIAEVLRARLIPAVFYKGVAMALTVYEDTGLRVFGDLDLLIDKADIVRTREALSSLGFARDPSVPPTAMAESLSRRDAFFWVYIDLHWDLAPIDGPLAAIRISPGEVLSRAHQASGVPVPSVEDNLLLSAVNLVRSLADRAVLVMDVARLCSAGPDWNAVLKRADRWHLNSSLWMAISLAERLFGARVPRDVMRATAPSRWRRSLIGALLEGPALWQRRKERHRFLAYALPFLCLDSGLDAARGVCSSARKRWG